MAYVGAFAVHGNDPELCLIAAKVHAGNRVKLLRWGTGVFRTGKGKDIVVIPINEAIERLRCLIVAETPAGKRDQLDGKADLVAAAYAYTSTFEDELPAEKIPRSTIQNHPSIRSQATRKAPSAAIFAHKKAFIREAVIAEMVISNLVADETGNLKIIGTKVDLYRLVQVYCGTAGVDAPTESLVLRRIHDMTSFFSLCRREGRADTGSPAIEDPTLKLWLDIQEMEP